MALFSKKDKKEPKNLKEVLAVLDKLKASVDRTSRELADFKQESQKGLHKVGLVRFNPFREIGGDQSFSLAVLDKDNTGFVITSLYGNESSRVYSKKITQGNPSHPLSKEEQQALGKAMQ